MNSRGARLGEQLRAQGNRGTSKLLLERKLEASNAKLHPSNQNNGICSAVRTQNQRGVTALGELKPIDAMLAFRYYLIEPHYRSSLRRRHHHCYLRHCSHWLS